MHIVVPIWLQNFLTDVYVFSPDGSTTKVISTPISLQNKWSASLKSEFCFKGYNTMNPLSDTNNCSMVLPRVDFSLDVKNIVSV